MLKKKKSSRKNIISVLKAKQKSGILNGYVILSMQKKISRLKLH